jgi:hypothetical protein
MVIAHIMPLGVHIVSRSDSWRSVLSAATYGSIDSVVVRHRNRIALIARGSIVRMTNRPMSEIIRRQKPTTLRPTATVQAAVCPQLSPTLQ